MIQFQLRKLGTNTRTKKIRYFISLCTFIIVLYMLDGYYFPTLETSISHLRLIHSWQCWFSLSTFAISLGLIVLFVRSAQLSPQWLKPVFVLYFSGAILVEYSYYGAVKRPLNPADLQMSADISLRMWLDAIQLFLKWQAFIPIFVFILFLLKYNDQHAPRRSLALTGIWLVVIAALSMIPDRPITFINWGVAPVNFTSVIMKYAISSLSTPERDILTFQSPVHPTNNIIFIIDESISADHLSLNGYKFETTPYLDTLAKNKALFHNWGVAVTGATCSESANALLITGVKVANGQLGRSYQYPTIFQYAKAMGYITYYFDAQTSVLWTGISDQDLVFVDNWVNTKTLGDNMFGDFEAADQVRKIVSKNTGNFILINKRGAHWAYERTYPASTAVWPPVNYTNIYNNAVRYNLNTFFETLIPDPGSPNFESQNTIYIYTSDHSESLFEERTESPHCGATLNETRVPLFIIGKLGDSVDTTYPASHSNILPTILDLMKYPQNARPPELNLSLLKAKLCDANDRFFFVGNTEEIIDYEVLEKMQNGW